MLIYGGSTASEAVTRRSSEEKESLFNKIAGCRHVTLTNSTLKQVFFFKFCKNLYRKVSIEHLRAIDSETCRKQWWKFCTAALNENAFTICPKNNAHFYEIGIFKNRI